jgi:hypothetical protein
MNLIRRFAALAIALLLGLAIAIPPVFASHTFATAFVSLYRDSTLVAEYNNFGASCTDTTCQIEVPVNRRDYNRFVRWSCIGFQTVVPAGATNSGNPVDCGSGRWFFSVYTTLPATHVSNVTVTVVLLLAP